MREDLQKFAFDMAENILKVNIKIVTDFKNYHIFHKDSYKYLPLRQIEENFRGLVLGGALLETAHEDTYYIIRTSLKISIAAIPLQEKDTDDFCVILIGPYLPDNFSEQMFDRVLKENRVAASSVGALRALYTTIPTALENQVENMAALIARHLLGWDAPKKEERTLQLYTALMEHPHPTESFRVASKVVEQRYEDENRFLRAIRRGNEAEALSMLKGWAVQTILPRPKDQIRSWKDLLLSANTLYRKAAESGDVHPVYLDYLSRQFALRIERCATVHQMEPIHEDMIRGYCGLVRKYSLSRYSKPVQRAMNHIYLNMTSDLSLQTVAEAVNLAPAYLSGLFKKETGLTLTGYIHTVRCRLAAELLVTTEIPVSEAAERAGINDSSYFTCLFKREFGVTPSEYRRRQQNSGNGKPS